MDRLNPNASVVRETARKANEANRKKRQDALAAKRGVSKSLSKEQKANLKVRKAASRKWIQGVLSNLDTSFQRDLAYNRNLDRIQRGEDVEEQQ